MSTVAVQPPYADVTINAQNDYVLVHPNSGTVTRWLIQFNNSGTFSGSVTIKGHVSGSALAAVAIPYTQLYINGAVGDGTQVSTAITTTSIIEVVADGMEVVFSVTSYVSGSGVLTVRPLLG